MRQEIPFFGPFFFNLRIINPQPLWNPQIALPYVASLTVGGRRDDGIRTGIFATPAGRAEFADEGLIVRTRSP